MDPAIKHAHISEARRKEWGPLCKRRVEADERHKQVALKKDLAILARVMKAIQHQLKFSERNRTRALMAYHANAAAINERRRRPHLLSVAFREALVEHKDRLARPAQLEKTFRKVINRAANRAEQKIRKRLCSRFERAMKQKAQSSFIVRLTGTSLAGVRAHLESLFVVGMAWDNHGYGSGRWNIDHIRPLASFSLSDPEQARQAFHFTNLQPLWHEVNMAKRDKFFPDTALSATHCFL